ncbi:MAG: sigma-70 family RNA polymerase sigma factor [Clostridia bacterium]|nr:sigma-70 family RNA polymerase sigma factor [Clostridia bacterium]
MSSTTAEGRLADERIIELYWQRDESAISETDAKYGGYIAAIAFNILSDDGDCEECKNDVYLALWNAIPPDRPRSFPAYLSKVTRNVALDRYREKNRQKRAVSEMSVCIDELSETIAGTADTEIEYEEEELIRVINAFVRALPSRRQTVFVLRYYYADKISSIADVLSVSESTVKKELAKIKKQLKKAVEKHGFNV